MMHHKKKSFQVDFSNPAFRTPGIRCHPRPMLELSTEHMLAFPWGPIYLWRVLGWARRLIWKTSGSGAAVGDIAFVELLVDFVLFTGTWPPRNVSSQSQRNSNYGFGEYILDDLGSAADTQALPLAAHSNVWKRSLLWIMKFLPNLVIKGSTIRHTASLALLGCPAWHEGLDTRPILACGHDAANALASYYVTKLGCKRNMDRVLQLDHPKPVAHPEEWNVPFKDRLPYIRSAKDIYAGNVT